MELKAYIDEKGQLIGEVNGVAEIIRKTKASAEKYPFVAYHVFGDGDTMWTAHGSRAAAAKHSGHWFPDSGERNNPAYDYEYRKKWGRRCYCSRPKETVYVVEVGA